MSNKEVTVSNGIDQITFEKQDGCDAVCIYLNDLYITSIHSSQCNDRGWDELRNLGNELPVDDQYEKTDGKPFPSWMDLDKSGSRV